uniref:Uncharacterized protein n=1 Tax=Anguilla anguilla TaxID=7936 RepID=A0A0E9S0G5_ANGAN
MHRKIPIFGTCPTVPYHFINVQPTSKALCSVFTISAHTLYLLVL